MNTNVRAQVTGNGTAADWTDFYGPNAGYVLELYERFLHEPGTVDAATRAFFERWRPPEATWPAMSEDTRRLAPPGASREAPDRAFDDAFAGRVAAASALATAVREYGHRAAHLDPLGSEPPGDAELEPATHGLREQDLDHIPASVAGGRAAADAVNARVAIEALRRIYCGTTGYDYDHVQAAAERVWLRDAAEARRFHPPHDPIDERGLLERLTEVGAFERFLHRTFPGQTRFSIEGTGMLIPMLDEIIGMSAEAGTRAILVGMAHRGRLNVMAHVLGKPHEEILAEFKQPSPRAGISWSGSSGEAFSGDVKYHLGARRAFREGRQVEMAVTLAPNPSHLEYVNPVVEGMARAADERRDQPGPPIQDETASLALLIHGDAAFPGQGVVAETLNLSRLPGYRAGGTIHIIVNNQLGFTVEAPDGRSTLYAGDLAKGFEIPIVHVNADDPEACIAGARLAHAYRETFHKDFLIDLIGYRRWGHNEGDDPTFTQPVMYARIAKHPTVREIWASKLVTRGVVTADDVAGLLAARTAELQEAMAEVNRRLAAAGSQQDGPPGPRRAQAAQAAPAEVIGSPVRSVQAARLPNAAGTQPPADDARPPATGLPLEQLATLNEAVYTIPPGFNLARRLRRPMQRRLEAFQVAASKSAPPAGGEAAPGPDGAADAADPAVPAGTIDWGQAETLAFAAILTNGTPVRLTGQDTPRGTFSQRHAVLHDAVTGERYTPLQALPSARASFEVCDSPLSENAVLGFEYGYSVQAPDALVLWEAQYGDFVNSAQVIVDQFIVSARAKWAQQPSVVLLLPHAYEGQGPEHSSARLERFLELAAEDNIRVANCTTAAQYFHLLRRQAALLRREPRPLIVMTPKSLLRHPLAASPPALLTEGTGFQPVLDDPFFDLDSGPAGGLNIGSGRMTEATSDNGSAGVPALSQSARGGVRRLVLCSGKVYVDVTSNQRRPAAAGLAVARLEQLYPFPEDELARVIDRYPEVREVIWLQEEPRNMGAWAFVSPRLQTLLASRRLHLRYVGRPEHASPSEGAPAWHAAEQARIVGEVLEGMLSPTEVSRAAEQTAATWVATGATRVSS